MKLNSPSLLLGFRAAVGVLESGREAFFGGANVDLPKDRSEAIAKDDLLPQFGFVGSSYPSTRVLLLGINPGNGPNTRRNGGDEIVMPALQEFFGERSEEAFLKAQSAYQKVCVSWPIWRRHCSEVIGAGRLSMDEVAYSNCLPWRTHTQAAFSDEVAYCASLHYVHPLIDELNPNLIVALGKKAAKILALGGRRFEQLIVWNRAQAATPKVIAERAATADRIFKTIGRTAK